MHYTLTVTAQLLCDQPGPWHTTIACFEICVDTQRPTQNHAIPLFDYDSLLKSQFFIVQKASAPKNGVAFGQEYIGAIRYSLAMPYVA